MEDFEWYRMVPNGTTIPVTSRADDHSKPHKAQKSEDAVGWDGKSGKKVFRPLP